MCRDCGVRELTPNDIKLGYIGQFVAKVFGGFVWSVILARLRVEVDGDE